MPSTTRSQDSPSLQDKHGKPIHVGDTVSTKFRGGKRAGEVTEVILTKSEAEEAGVKNPPKVAFEDQHGHSVAHNPKTLVHGDNPEHPQK